MAEQLLQQAQELKKKGQVNNAVEIYRALIAQDPQSVQAYRQLGDILFNQKKLEEAVQHYQKVVELAPKLPHAHFRLGQIYKAQRQLVDAVEHLQRAIDLNPKNPWFHKELGESYQIQEQSGKAEEAFQHAIELKPEMADAYFRLGIVQQNQKKLDKAIAALESLLDLNPMHVGAYQRSGDIYAQQKKNRKAIAHYQKAIELKDDNPFLHAKLARVLNQDGQVKSAISAWQAAIQLKGDRYQFHEQLGDLLLQHEDFERAIASYERAIVLQPHLSGLKGKLNTVLQRKELIATYIATITSDDLVSTKSTEVEVKQSESAEIDADQPERQTLSKLASIEVSQRSENTSSEPYKQIESEISKSEDNPVQTITASEIVDSRTFSEEFQKPIQEQSLKPKSNALQSIEKNHHETSETLVLNVSALDSRGNSSDLQEVPIAIDLTKTINQGKGEGKSGKVPFSKHRRRGPRSIKLDSTGFQKDFSFSVEEVGGYDENIPSPVKKILLFLLLGFYGAIALTLFLRGLTVLGILLVAIAALIILIFWGFRKLK